MNRVLLDPGSEANLLQLPAFKQMKLTLGILNSVRRILSDFNEATIVTLGDVVLPVKAGPITQQILFSIVEDLGPYNAIMGAGLSAFDEGYPFDLPPNDQLFD